MGKNYSEKAMVLKELDRINKIVHFKLSKQGMSDLATELVKANSAERVVEALKEIPIGSNHSTPADVSLKIKEISDQRARTKGNKVTYYQDTLCHSKEEHDELTRQRKLVSSYLKSNSREKIEKITKKWLELNFGEGYQQGFGSMAFSFHIPAIIDFDEAKKSKKNEESIESAFERVISSKKLKLKMEVS